jgi:hypothetical protein
METLNYREIVKNFIQKYAQEECVEDSENIELVFDRTYATGTGDRYNIVLLYYNK